MKEESINKPFIGLFSELLISSTTFQAGGVYILKDKDVLFPSRTNIKDEDKPRMVIVMGREKELNDPLIEYVQAIPITTCFKLETTHDYPLDKGAGNLHYNSLAKAGLIQPILKTNIEGKIGQLPPEIYDDVKATVMVNLDI